ncbi:MAG: hypothetical protein RHS_3630 [Robinsoniella sp. RHS]|nr:MAG: hypothetical protein RHS_3630 [Robinsoniella sp. RHS]
MSAQALRTKKSRLIGVIVPKISSESISNMVNGISQILTKNGYHILLGNTENNLQKELEYINVFRNNHVDGIVFIATVFTRKHIEELKSLDAPVVILGQELEGYCSVFHDDYHAARDLTESMIQAGCRNIGYLGVTEKDRAVGVDRKEGFLNALKASGGDVDRKAMRVCEFNAESGYRQMRQLLEEKPDLDGVVCVTDSIALGAIECIREKGLRIPEDISVVGMGDSQFSKVITPKLTTARYFYEQSGQEAAEMLVNLIDAKETHVKKLKLGYEIIQRNSVRKKEDQ